MVNGFWYYRALESVRMIASALSTALTIYPCQIRVHQRWQSKLQLPTAGKKEWRPATAGSSPPCGYLSTLWYTLTLVGLEPITFWSLVRRATSSATEPTNHVSNKKAGLSQRWPRDTRYISRSWAVAEIWPFEIIRDGGRRHLEFVRIENSAIRSAVPENPTL